MRIGEIAERSGVSTKTLRFYEQAGLVQPPARRENGYRDFGDDVLGRLEFIRAAQSSGLTLAEIRGVIAVRDGGEAPCSHVLGLIEQRTAEIDRRIAELRELRADLAVLAERAQTLNPVDCSADSVCEILSPR